VIYFFYFILLKDSLSDSIILFFALTCTPSSSARGDSFVHFVTVPSTTAELVFFLNLYNDPNQLSVRTGVRVALLRPSLFFFIYKKFLIFFLLMFRRLFFCFKHFRIQKKKEGNFSFF
jgi:hypothetical protein